MTATAQGTLAKTPFPQILTFLWKKQLSGSLTLTDQDAEELAKVHFLGGRPAHVEGGGAGTRLGELLIIRGIIKAKTLAEALRGAKDQGVVLGRYLLEQGLVQAGDLGEAMKFQVEQKLMGLYALDDADFEFFPGENLTAIEEEDMFAVDPFASMPKALRDKWKTGRLDEQLSRLEGHGIRISGRMMGEPAWSDEEQEALGLLRIRVNTLHSALEAKPHLEQPMRVVLYVLMLTGGLELVKPPEETTGEIAAQMRSAMEPQKPQKPPDVKVAAMRTRAQEKIAQIKDGDLFAALEVPETAGAEEIRASYLALVKQFHPDRAAATDDAQLREAMVYISTRLREAADTLTDPARRGDYERARAGGPTRDEEDAIVQQTLAAELAFQKAGILARKKKWDETILAMEQVVRADPENGDYLALLAWARANHGPGGADLAQHEADLRNAVTLAPRSEKANYYLAQVLKRNGKESEAYKHLEIVASINPHNIDVKRELHILSRRQGKAKKSTGGLFSGLRKSEPPRNSSAPPPSRQSQPPEDESTLGKLKKILTKKL